MSNPTTDPELLRIWLCNGCYGRDIYPIFDHGYLADITATVTRNTAINLSGIGIVPITLTRRNFNKSYAFKRDFFNNHGIIHETWYNAPNLEFWNTLPGAGGCWGGVRDTLNGSYSVENLFINSQIYYADLRDDTIVYYQEEGAYSGGDSGGEPIGQKTVFADFGGDKPSCKTIWIYDAVPLDISLSASGSNSEKINSLLPYNATSTSSATVHTAASDGSGYCGNGTFGCYRWGTYSVVDTSVQISGQPCNCAEGECPEVIAPHDLSDFFNSFDSFGIFRQMDDYDYSLFHDATDRLSEGYQPVLQPGAYDYPIGVAIDPMPHGSWVTDATGNYFYSMITKDKTVFNRLNEGIPPWPSYEPATYGGTPITYGGAGVGTDLSKIVVYYPLVAV